MANKERNKRSARKARAQARADREAAQVASAPAAGSKAKATSQQSKAVATKKEGRRGPFKRLRAYFADVRTEMRRVVWPSRAELKSYSVGVIATLFVFGIAIWALDLGVVGLLTVFAGLGR